MSSQAPQQTGGRKTPKWKTPQAAAFGFGLTGAWAAIAVLWLITPFCYGYVLWTLITLAPSLSSARPASHGALRVLHYIVLGYCALEIPFSVWYRYLAWRANSLRPPPRYTRKFLRSVFKRSLENGLDPEDMEDELEAQALKEVAKSISRNDDRRNSYELRHRKAPHPSSTPDLRTTTSTLTSDAPRRPEINDEDTSNASWSNASLPGTIKAEERPKSQGYTPSFITSPLAHDDPRAHDFRDFLRLWFYNCPYEDIYRLNMCDWLSWSLYGQPYEELVVERAAWEKAGRPPRTHHDGEPDIDEEGLEIDGDKLGLVEHCVDMVEARAATRFKVGRNPTVRVIRLTLDPVRVLSRPLILYVFVWCLQKTIVGNSKLHGFREVRDGDTRYLIRMPKGWKPSRTCAESERPLLFIHGLGMGMAQYATMLGYLSTAPTLKNRPLVVLIQPHISMSFFSKGYLQPPDKETCTAGLMRIAKRWGFEEPGLTVLSHSNGSIVHGWLLKEYPDLVARSCFVDPVCFCLWEPWVCYNFLYSSARTPIEYLMRYFVSRELGVALMLQRAFNWSSNLLFPSEIPNLTSPFHASFFLAGRDSILHAERIRRYLRKHGVKEVAKGENVGEGRGGLKVHAGKKHGESMIGGGRAFNQIMAWVTCEVGEDGRTSADSDSLAL